MGEASIILFKPALHLHKFILPAAQSNFLGILEAAFPVGIRVDEFEEFVGSIGVRMGVIMAA